jgi:hypothetical protein
VVAKRVARGPSVTGTSRQYLTPCQETPSRWEAQRGALAHTRRGVVPSSHHRHSDKSQPTKHASSTRAGSNTPLASYAEESRPTAAGE